MPLIVFNRLSAQAATILLCFLPAMCAVFMATLSNHEMPHTSQPAASVSPGGRATRAASAVALARAFAAACFLPPKCCSACMSLVKLAMAHVVHPEDRVHWGGLLRGIVLKMLARECVRAIAGAHVCQSVGVMWRSDCV